MTNWNELRDATGAATQIPAQLAALGGEGPSRDGATRTLMESLVRAGETFSAAPAALDVLGPAVAARTTGAHRSCWVLGEIFAAGHLSRVANQATHASPARDAVLARATSARVALLPALAADDPAWRSGAAFALAFVPDVDAQLLADAARGERDVHVRASLLFALGVRARDDERAGHELRAFGSGDDTVLARALAGEPAPASDLSRGLVAWWLRPVAQELTPWGGLVMGAARWLEAMVPDKARRRELAPDLAEALVSPPRERTDPRRPALAKLILHWAGLLEDYPPRHVARVERLDPGARRIAELFATDDSLGVAETALAGGARALQRWLGVLPPGPLEAPGPDGQPRWVGARELLAAGRSFPEILDWLVEGLAAHERLDALTELMRGAYRIVWDARGRIGADALSDALERAGGAAVDWAERIVAEVITLPDGIRDYRALAGFTSDHFMIALKLLVRGGVRLDARVARDVPLEHADAREVLAALPPEAVRRATLERWRAGAANPAARGAFIKTVMPLFDVAGSADLAREMLQILEAPTTKQPGLAPAVLEQLARIASG